MNKTCQIIFALVGMLLLAATAWAGEVQAAEVTVGSSATNVQVGNEFTVDIAINGVANLYAAGIDFTYDPANIAVDGITRGDLLPDVDLDLDTEGTQTLDSLDLMPVSRENGDGTTTLYYAFTQVGETDGISGDGILFSLHLRGLVPGTATVSVGPVGAGNATLTLIDYSGETPAPIDYTLAGATPGVVAVNINGIQQPAAPQATPAGGVFAVPVDVTLENGEGADIYYTTDGSDPSVDSTLYEGPITIDHTLTLKAIAVVNDISSVIASWTFTITPPVEDHEVVITEDLAITPDPAVDLAVTRPMTVTARAGEEVTWSVTIVSSDGFPGFPGFVATETFQGTELNLTWPTVDNQVLPDGDWQVTVSATDQANNNKSWPTQTVAVYNNPVRIAQVRILNAMGGDQNEFVPGDTYMTKATVINMENSTLNEPLVLVKVERQAGVSEFIGISQNDIAANGTSSPGSGTFLPQNAVAGTYTANVMVWSNWLSLGGAPLAASASNTFVVNPLD